MIMGFENPTVDVGTKTLIFEVVDRQRSHFKEIRRVARCFLSSGEQSRTKFVTIEGETVLIEEEIRAGR